jgi:hypothetical protein
MARRGWRKEFKFWKGAGVTHVTLNSAFGTTITAHRLPLIAGPSDRA